MYRNFLSILSKDKWDEAVDDFVREFQPDGESEGYWEVPYDTWRGYAVQAAEGIAKDLNALGFIQLRATDDVYYFYVDTTPDYQGRKPYAGLESPDSTEFTYFDDITKHWIRELWEIFDPEDEYAARTRPQTV